MPAEITERHSAVPWRDMRDIRNVVVHEYFGVSLSILFQAVRNDLPPLVPQLTELLVRLGDS